MTYTYRFEELKFEQNFFGVFEVVLLVNADFVVTDWSIEPAEEGVSYDGGKNLPEPRYPESFAIDEWYWDNVEVCVLKPEAMATEWKPVTVDKHLKTLLDNQLDWWEMNQWLTEQVRG